MNKSLLASRPLTRWDNGRRQLILKNDDHTIKYLTLSLYIKAWSSQKHTNSVIKST